MRVARFLVLAFSLVLAAPSLAAKALPDLVVTRITLPTHAVGGTTVTVRDTVANQGRGSAAGSRTGFYLSFDKRLDDNDIKLTTTRAVPRLRRDKLSVGATKVVVPIYLTGLFEVLACSDDAATVKESNEKNNCRAARNGLTISLPPQS